MVVAGHLFLFEKSRAINTKSSYNSHTKYTHSTKSQHNPLVYFKLIERKVEGYGILHLQHRAEGGKE